MATIEKIIEKMGVKNVPGLVLSNINLRTKDVITYEIPKLVNHKVWEGDPTRQGYHGLEIDLVDAGRLTVPPESMVTSVTRLEEGDEGIRTEIPSFPQYVIRWLSEDQTPYSAVVLKDHDVFED